VTLLRGRVRMRIQLVTRKSEIPTWLDEAAKEELDEMFEDDDFDRSALVLRFDGTEVAEVYYDNGEVEDQTFGRDWDWVEDAIKRAFEAGRVAERAHAMPVKTDARVEVFELKGPDEWPSLVRAAGLSCDAYLEYGEYGKIEIGINPDATIFGRLLRADGGDDSQVAPAIDDDDDDDDE
jgi:hypothetical protein